MRAQNGDYSSFVDVPGIGVAAAVELVDLVLAVEDFVQQRKV